MRSTSSERGGEEDDRDVRMAAQFPADVETAQVRQADVEDDQGVIAAGGEIQGLPPEAAAAGAVALGAKGVGQGIGDGRFVVHDEDVHGVMIIHPVRRNPHGMALLSELSAPSSACYAGLKETIKSSGVLPRGVLPAAIILGGSHEEPDAGITGAVVGRGR